MSAVTLEQQAGGWRAALNGAWSLGAMPAIEAELNALPPLTGEVTCDWSGVVDPSIGTAWLLLTRLTTLTSKDIQVTHVAAPPMLGFLQQLDLQRRARGPEPLPAAPAGFLGRLGRWTYVQGVEVRGVLDFFGRIIAVVV